MWENRLDRLPELRLAGGSVRIAIAEGALARLVGLALMDPPPGARALLIPRCRSVHTIGMRFPLDLIWLDEDGTIDAVDAAVPPGTHRRNRSAGGVVETPAGYGAAVFAAIARSGVLL